MSTVKRFGNYKKGQAAMEFLMTYGWAILVVLVVIGALAYFGVLNPQQFLPTKCQLPVGLACTDYAIGLSASQTQLVLSNGLGTDIKLTSLAISSDTALFQCNATGTTVAKVLTAGQDYKHIFVTDAAARNDLAGANYNGCYNDPSLTKGVRIKGPLIIQYTNLRTQLDQTLSGTLIADVAG
ncbi:hypothetical protein HYU17_01775 [Candidatus Woesearchaeota archaeon]|nr:hypothetical protein [Candidatus Woesearchaeota archaeon]